LNTRTLATDYVSLEHDEMEEGKEEVKDEPDSSDLRFWDAICNGWMVR
jgi:hypothetical protein